MRQGLVALLACALAGVGCGGPESAERAAVGNASKLDVPPPPAPFSGIELPQETPIPPEVEQALDADAGAAVSDLSRLLLTYPQAEVRRTAAWQLAQRSEAEDMTSAVPALRGALRDPDWLVRSNAADALGAYGSHAKDAVGELTAAVDDPNAAVAKSAVEALAELGRDAAPAAPRLLRAIQGDEFCARKELIVALGKIGPSARPAIPKLAEALGDEDLRYAAVHSLARLGAEQELLVALSRGKNNDSLRLDIADAADQIERPSPKMVQAVIQLATADKADDVRAQAAMSLGRMRPSTRAISAALVQAAGDRNGLVRARAVESLGDLAPKFDEAIATLRERTNDDHEWVREFAKEALVDYPGTADIQLDLLIDELLEEGEIGWAFANSGLEYFSGVDRMARDEDLDEARRAVAVMAVAEYVKHADSLETDEQRAETVGLFKSMLDDEQTPVSVRAAAALMLRLFGERHPAQQAAWVAGLRSARFREVRIECAKVMQEEDVEGGIPALIDVLEDEDEEVVMAAVETLAKFGREAADAVAPLAKLAEQGEALYPRGVVLALQSIGEHPEISVPVLEKLLEDPLVGDAAASAIASIKRSHNLDVTDLLHELSERLANAEDDRDIQDALFALTILGQKAAPLVPKLLPYLKHDSAQVRKEAGRLLGWIGPDASEAAPLLLKEIADWKSGEAGTSAKLEDPFATRDPFAPVDPGPPLWAISALGSIQAGGKAFAAMAPGLLEDRGCRVETLNTLAALGADAADAAPAVEKLLKSPDAEERTIAARTLWKINPAAAKQAGLKRPTEPEEDIDSIE
ncbi:MAG: HEAT repeat domain-containing protein [Pirellulaceae bacterium]